MAEDFIPRFIANWKMQMSLQQTMDLITQLRQTFHTYTGPVKMIVCPSFTSLADAARLLDGSKIKLGAQDTFWDDRGAYTGEISPLQLQELKVEYVIVGHSERRNFIHEDDATISRKMVAALAHGLQPVLCVGETGEQRSRGDHERVVQQQLTEALRSVPPPSQGHRIAIAYEPIWAIGTGQSADPDQATEMRHVIFQTLVDLYDEKLVEKNFSILYGGSVDGGNIRDYVDPDRFDGALAGTSSLKVESFATMISELTEIANGKK